MRTQTYADIGIKGRTVWMFRDRLSLAWGWYPQHRGRRYYASENGGRLHSECLDLNVGLGRLSLSATFWGLGWASRLVRWIPCGKHGRGHAIGWWAKDALSV